MMTTTTNGALSKGFRLWFEDLVFEDFQLITVEPAAHNWKRAGLANLNAIFETEKPNTLRNDYSY